MYSTTYLCGNTSSRLNTLRISSPSNTNNKSGCPIRPPTLAIFPYCFCNEFITLSRSCIRYCPVSRKNNVQINTSKIRMKFISLSCSFLSMVYSRVYMAPMVKEYYTQIYIIKQAREFFSISLSY